MDLSLLKPNPRSVDTEIVPGTRHARQQARLRRWMLVSAGAPLLVLLVVPIVALLVRASPAAVLSHLGDPSTVQAIELSLSTSTTTALIVMILGTPLAYLLARRRFRLHRLLEVLIDWPTVLPPAVAGLALLMAFGRRGLVGSWLETAGIEIAFTPAAVVMAQAFVAASYYVKTAEVSLAAVSGDLEQAAALDGASALQTFRYVTLPLAWRGMVGGAALCWARALGEFGATIIFAGNFPGRTQTMPLAVYLGFEIDLSQALTLAAILLLLSFSILLAVRAVLHDTPEEAG